MTLADCIKLANEVMVASVATVEGDQPHVRVFAMWFADETGFYFHSGTPKPTIRQLKANPKIEVCFYKPGPEQMPGTMLRVAGKAEFLNDRALNERLINERPFLRQMGISGPDDPMIAVFRIARGECRYWTMDANWQEHVERVEF